VDQVLRKYRSPNVDRRRNVGERQVSLGLQVKTGGWGETGGRNVAAPDAAAVQANEDDEVAVEILIGNRCRSCLATRRLCRTPFGLSAVVSSGETLHGPPAGRSVALVSPPE
jgi:hypothetical protein